MQNKKLNNIEAETAPAVPANGNSHAESGVLASAWDLEPTTEGGVVIVPPSALTPGGHAESVDPEVVDVGDVDEDSDTADNMDQTQWWAPRLRYPLTAGTLFRQALNFVAGDPARREFGYFYEAKLKRECAITLEFPIHKNDRMGLWTAILRRRQNCDYFRCSAIDVVLYAYWNMLMKGAKQ